MIAASEEMHDEKLKFSSLIRHLNEVLRPRGIELECIKWNPETDGSIEEYKAKLKECEMCLTLYWRDLAGNSEHELDTAYQELKDGNNPRNLYVFFKEPTEDLTDALRDFKANFVTKYGHFFCKFENVDTMNLHFVLQFEASQNRLKGQHDELVKVTGGKVIIGEYEIVNLDNIPFTALNKKYQQMQIELLEIEKQLAETQTQYMTNPKDLSLLNNLTEVNSKRKNIADEFEKFQNHLYDIALNFVKISEEDFSKRMQMARELFEKGNNVEADILFNPKEMMREDEIDRKVANELHRKREKRIVEFLQAAKFAIANTERPVFDRFTRACEEYECAIKIAKEIHYDADKFAEILCDYAFLLGDFNYINDSVNTYQEALNIFKKLSETNPALYLPHVADIMSNIACHLSTLGLFDKARENFLNTLSAYKKLAESQNIRYLPDVARTLCNLGLVQHHVGLIWEAEEKYKEALSIYKDLNRNSPNMYLSDLASALDSFATLQSDGFENYTEAINTYAKALEIERKLADSNPNEYLPDVVRTSFNIALLKTKLGFYDEAEKEFMYVIQKYAVCAKQHPYKYLPLFAKSISGVAELHNKLSHYADAEYYFMSALHIFLEFPIQNPEQYLSDVCVNLQYLAKLQSHLHNYEMVKEVFKKALEGYRPMANKYPKAYLVDVTNIQISLSEMLLEQDCKEEAANSYWEALVYCLEFSEEINGADNAYEINFCIKLFWALNKISSAMFFFKPL